MPHDNYSRSTIARKDATMTDASNTPLPIDSQLRLVGRLIGRELHAAKHGEAPESDATAALRDRITGALAEGDLDVLQRALDAIARELGWDESQPMPERPDRGHRRGFGRHPMPAPGEPHRFGEFGHGDHPHHRGFAGEHPRHRDFAGECAHRGRGHGRHAAMADAFERGFTRGYEQAQRD
jgi:hypothetical protein